MDEDLSLWQLEISYTVQCVRCFLRFEVPNKLPQEVITLLKEEGWQIRPIGPWCPECAPLLNRCAIGRPPRFILGKRVYKKYSCDPLGALLSLGDGYAEVRMNDGNPSVYALCELTTRPYPSPRLPPVASAQIER